MLPTVKKLNVRSVIRYELKKGLTSFAVSTSKILV